MDDDELGLPFLACVEDAFYQIFRNQYEAELEEPATKEPTHEHRD